MSSFIDSELAGLAGLGSAKRALRALLAHGEGVHAVLLYGAEGAGKGKLARVLSQAWTCAKPDADGGACGTCAVCGAFGRGNCADFQWIDPYGPSRWLRLGCIHEVTPPDKDFTGVPVLEFLRSGPLSARHKVVVLNDAHRMNAAAANALLKTLEEPHPFAKLILLTPTVGSVLPTILSRCLAIACELPSDEERSARFPEIDADAWALAANAPGRATRHREHADLYVPIAEFARNLPRRPRGAALALADEFRALAEPLAKARNLPTRTALGEALELLALAVVRSSDPDPEFAQRVVEAHRRIEGNANPGMTLDALFAGRRKVRQTTHR